MHRRSHKEQTEGAKSIARHALANCTQFVIFGKNMPKKCLTLSVAGISVVTEVEDTFVKLYIQLCNCLVNQKRKHVKGFLKTNSKTFFFCRIIMSHFPSNIALPPPAGLGM